MLKCPTPDCGGELKPLFTGFYCSNECDTPAGKAFLADKRNILAAEQKVKEDAEKFRLAGGWFGLFPTLNLTQQRLEKINWATIKKAPNGRPLTYVNPAIY